MPIRIIQSSYTDNFGNGGLPAYTSNAGDRFNVLIDIESNVRVLSGSSVYLTINAIDGEIEWTGGNYLEEGFRVGDNVQITKYDQGGNVLITWSANLLFVSETIIDLDNTQTSGYDIGAGERLEVLLNVRGRSDLELNFNHILNSANQGVFSLIDGEATRVLFDDFGSLSVGGNQPGVLVGNQSGQFLISAQIERLANAGNQTRAYRLSIDFVNSGIYDEAWFQSSDCLKLFILMDFASLPGEFDNRYVAEYSEDANTGWYDEPYNTAPVDSTLIQGITSDVEYCKDTTHEIIVDGPISDIGLGAAYVSIDESYYKNRTFRQNEITMLIPSFDTGLAFANSDVNEDGAGYTITINSVNTIGSQTTINFTFSPNPNFNTFMDGRDPNDRLFYIWVKCGAINHLVFSDQLVCILPPGDPITMIDEASFLDHSENVNTFSGQLNYTNFDTEDDLGFFGSFLLDKNKIYENISIKVEAYNTATEEDFTLSEFAFTFNGVQISGDGRYLLNESQTIIPQLPTNSLKRDSIFQLEPSLDNPTEYGVSLFVPVLLRWEYWLEQLNASSDFWPTQDKNWEQYDNLGDWIVRLEILLSDGVFAYPYTKQIQINPYDFEDFIDSEITMFREVDGQLVNIIVEGEIMRIRADHKLLNGQNWESAWGMITVEPKEASPRFICSSVLPFDNNANNPLRPEDNVQMIITYPTPDVARMECLFNPDLINLSNGVKFTSKIKGCPGDQEIGKTMTDGTQKTTTTGDDKTLAI